MSGYGNADDDAINAAALVDNGIGLARLMIPTGPSSLVCLDCGEEIPKERREAQQGCKFCITCQPFHDKAPKLKVLDRIL